MPWEAFDIPEDVPDMDLRDVLDAKLTMIQGVLRVFTHHPRLSEVAETSGLSEMAWAGSTMVDEILAILEVQTRRANAKTGRPS
jgi:hypothetical protein